MADGITCKKCLGRIDEMAFKLKKKVHDKLYPGEPFLPPKLCLDCVLEAFLEFAGIGEEDPYVLEGFKFSAAEDDSCNEMINNYVCSLPKGHSGEHVGCFYSEEGYPEKICARSGNGR